jgi:hypothetical protein
VCPPPFLPVECYPKVSFPTSLQYGLAAVSIKIYLIKYILLSFQYLQRGN